MLKHNGCHGYLMTSLQSAKNITLKSCLSWTKRHFWILF